MEKLIACCGIDCSVCDARIATIQDNNDLRKATAEKWQKLYNAPNIAPEMINCTGCRAEGVKFSHCSQCEIRKCADAKGFVTCGECSELDLCQIIAGVHKFMPEALQNLKQLN